MSYKGKFAECIKMIPDALAWVEKQDVEGLRQFFWKDAHKPLSLVST